MKTTSVEDRTRAASKLACIAVAMLWTAPVPAGVRIETASRDAQTHALIEGGGEVLLIQDGKVSSARGNSSSTTLIDGTTFYVLDRDRKTYYVMDDAAIRKAAAQAAAMQKEMQERVRKMPPEQRAMMEQGMGAQMPGIFGKKDEYEWKDTGQDETVDGWRCHTWNLLRNGAVQEDHCVVPFASIPGHEDLARANRDLWDAFVAGTAGLISVTEYADARKSLDGYGVRLRLLDVDGKPRGNETVVIRCVEESLPTSTFEIPAGFRKVPAPKPGR